MTSSELRKKYLEFFKSKGHTVIPSASLVPRATDQSVLFTTAGMHPLVPYFFGEKHPGGKRITNVQKCVRTGDIDDVGDNRHLTFFEMMGNWSFGDPSAPDGIGRAGYFKKEAIEWSFEFLTGKEWLNLDPKRIYVTVFKGSPSTSSGNNGIPRDEEAIEIWKKVFKEKAGMDISVAGEDEMISAVGALEIPSLAPDESKLSPAGSLGIIKNDIRIVPLGVEDNFWIAGETGPCGPDTEMFYDTRPEDGLLEGKFFDLVKNFRLIEIWNNVFMEYEKKAISDEQSAISKSKYEYIKLKQKNVDTGMGIERTLAVLTGKKTVFETDLFEPIFERISEMSGKKYDENIDTQKAFRIIADHIKASIFIISDGVLPSNVGRGYVLRRLIRRTARYARTLNLQSNFYIVLIKEIIEIYKNQYPELVDKESHISSTIGEELEKFNKTLEKGLKEFERAISATWSDANMVSQKDESEMSMDAIKKLPAKIVFDLYQTYGFPIEMTRELAKEYGIIIDEEGFNEELKKHQEISRAGAENKFGGHGIKESEKRKGESEKMVQLHTTTHLLHQALRLVLGPIVRQMGSDINPKRLRFDFSFDRKMTPEEIKSVEEIVNEQIQNNLAVKSEEMTFEEATHNGALAFFKDKYPEKVKVYSMGDFSKEVCGGPHIENTSELGEFKIQKEEASSAGVRRIKVILAP